MDKLWIPNRRNEMLSAYYFEARPEARYVLIVSHGFRGAKENAGRIFGFADRLNGLGISVLAFDFAGSGKSEGSFADMTLSRQAEDLHAVIDYAKEQVKKPILLLGRSFGGSTTLLAASQRSDINGCILWSTPVHLLKTFTKMMPDEYMKLKNGQTTVIKDDAGEFTLRPAFAQDLEEQAIDSCLSAIGSIPVLIIHGREDEVVSPDNARYIAGHLVNASLHLVQGADHRFIERSKEREDITLQWIQEKF